MNEVMSLGIPRIWKTAPITQLKPKENMNIIDVAGGTGDISGRILKKTDNKASVTICDININMMEVYRDKLIDRGIINKVQSAQLVCSNAEELPFPNASFDAYVIAFGLRNVTHIEKALLEAHRVIKPGGRFICLEFSKVENEFLDKIYKQYSKIIPKIGRVIVGKSYPYEYLTASIKNFYKQDELLEKINKSKFKKVEYSNLFGGIASITSV